MKNAIARRMLVLVPLLAALAFCGCATIYENTHAYLGSRRFAPTVPANVQILAAAPQQPVERLGEIVLSIEGNPSRQKLESRLKAAGATLGADGVYIASDQTHIYPVVYWDAWGPASGEDWHRVVVGVAFKNR